MSRKLVLMALTYNCDRYAFDPVRDRDRRDRGDFLQTNRIPIYKW